DDIDLFAIAPNDGAVATSSRHEPLCLYDGATGKKQRLSVSAKARIVHLSFSPDGRTLVAISRKEEVAQLWETKSARLVRRLRLPGLALSDKQAALALSWDGKSLASVELDAAVRLWDAATGEPRLRLPGHVQAP